MKLEAENHKKMGTILYNKEPLALVNSMESYFKERPPDCSLFSQDNFGIPVHKEVLYQTPFLRRMIRSFNMDSCCSKIEILCPSLSREDLGAVVQFLYSGKISRFDSAVESKLSNILTELFGFPSIDKNGDSKQSIVLEPIAKKRKMSSNSNSLPVEVSIKEEPEDYDVSDTDKKFVILTIGSPHTFMNSKFIQSENHTVLTVNAAINKKKGIYVMTLLLKY